MRWVPYAKFRTRLNVTLYVRWMNCFDVVNNDSLKVCAIGPFVRHVLYWIFCYLKIFYVMKWEDESFVTLIHCVCVVTFFL